MTSVTHLSTEIYGSPQLKPVAEQSLPACQTHFNSGKEPDTSAADSPASAKPVFQNVTPPCKLPAKWFQPDPDGAATSSEAVHQAALRYLTAGLSVIPIAGDGSKQPDSQRLPRPWDAGVQRRKTSWLPYQMRRARPEEVDRWFQVGGRFGLAVVGGMVSGGGVGCGLEVIDFDTAELAKPWAEQVERQAPGLLERLVRVQSPRPGLHVYYRCPAFGGSQKLALGPDLDADGKPKLDGRGRGLKKTLIELKGEGGYCIVPPSPRCCHPRNLPYRLVEGSLGLEAVPTITPQERRVLLDAARALNQWNEPAKPPRRVRRRSNAAGNLTDRPGDEFNALAEWSDILEPHGWASAGSSGEVEYWRRQGKSDGISATANYAGNGFLHVFSSNAAPFEQDKSYSKFHAYTLLEHGGDFVSAARALRDKGYGRVTLRAGKGNSVEPSRNVRGVGQ
jgi:putative DNA primase/helicase